MKENKPMSRSIEGMEEGFVVLKYTALFTVNELVERYDCERAVQCEVAPHTKL